MAPTAKPKSSRSHPKAKPKSSHSHPNANANQSLPPCSPCSAASPLPAGSAVQAVRQARLDAAIVAQVDAPDDSAQARCNSTDEAAVDSCQTVFDEENDMTAVSDSASADISVRHCLPDPSTLSSSFDDAWNEFKNKFDMLTRGMVSALSGLAEETAAEHLRRLSEASAVRQLHERVVDERYEPARKEVCARLRATGYTDPTNSCFWHGRAYVGPPAAPVKTWTCEKPPRDDHDSPAWLTASEFQDVSEVMQAKVAQLARLMRMSKRTVIYTGAGISASVVGQAARGGQNEVGFVSSPLKAQPTFTHYALGLLGTSGFIDSWVQQNHDCLPQKAGFPQECINEVHGSWYDPSNPVVKYNGNLRKDAGDWMALDADTADFVIVLGSSLGGLNADRVPKEAAERSLQMELPASHQPVPGVRLIICLKSPGPHYYGTIVENKETTLMVQLDTDEFPSPIEVSIDHKPMEFIPGGALGTACINLQQTPCDGMMSLRLFGTSDDILRMLLKELGLSHPCVPKGPERLKDNCVLVPYGPDGKLLRPGEGKRMWLNLNVGLEVRITDGHNIQGAKQPKYLHIGASEPVTFLSCRRNPAEPCGFVRERSDDMHAFVLEIAGVDMNLGIWWLEVAMRGAVEKLPIVNQYPQYEDETPEDPKAVLLDKRAWWEKGEDMLPRCETKEKTQKLKRSLSGEALDPAPGIARVKAQLSPRLVRKSSF